MANLSILLNAVLTATDTITSPNPTVVTRNFNNPTLAATTYFHDLFFQAAAAGSAVTLPAATVWIVYVKNNDAAANLTVAFTPAGGASETVLLVPGGIFLYFQPSEGAGGITALTLTASAGTINTEVFVAK